MKNLRTLPLLVMIVPLTIVFLGCSKSDPNPDPMEQWVGTWTGTAINTYYYTSGNNCEASLGSRPLTLNLIITRLGESGIELACVAPYAAYSFTTFGRISGNTAIIDPVDNLEFTTTADISSGTLTFTYTRNGTSGCTLNGMYIPYGPETLEATLTKK